MTLLWETVEKEPVIKLYELIRGKYDIKYGYHIDYPILIDGILEDFNE